MRVIVYFILLLQCLHDVFALNILVIFHSPVQSHHFLGSSLCRTLANAGHNITFITLFNEPKLPDNVEVIELVEFMDSMKDMKTNSFEREHLPAVFNLFELYNYATVWAEKFFASPQIKQLLKSNKQYDVVIVDEFATDSTKIFAYHYKTPLVLFSTIGTCRWVNRIVGNPEPPSYIPDFFLGMSHPLSFYERVYNFIFGLLSELSFHYYSIPTQNAILKKYFPDAPDLRNIIYNVSLVLTNSHESIKQPVPTVPNMIGIGGIHVNPAKKLPDDLQTFMDNAKDGVIYFSMGTLLRPSQMPKRIKNAILKVFKNRKEKILWKWDEISLENKTENIVISKWFPQQGILAHPNCKLFISHGGLLSTTESIAMGVPILAIPIRADQKLNAAQITGIGVGKSLPFPQVNEENFKAVMDEILENPKYRETAQLRSKLFHDRPVKATNLAVYWIEYIARHQGAPHLKTAGTELPWYQYLLLDVIAALVAGIILIVLIVLRICKYVKPTKKNKSKKE